MKRCAFTGSRPEKMPVLENTGSAEYTELVSKIKGQVIRLIKTENVTRFLSGAARGIDLIAAEIVLELKEQNPELQLECVVPYKAQADYWNDSDKARYHSVLKRCDTVTLLQEQYTSGCLQRRNRYLVDNADVVLAVWNGTKGGTEYTVKYAKKQNKKLIIISVDQNDGGCCANT